MKGVVVIWLLFPLLACTAPKKEVHPMGDQIVLPIAKENLLGIGFLQISIHKPIPLYLTPESKTPFDAIEFVPKKWREKGSYEIRTTVLKERLKPEKAYGGMSNKEGEESEQHGLIHFAPELMFRVVGATDTWFRVMINEETKETAVVRVDPGFRMYRSAAEMNHMPGFLLGEDGSRDCYLYETWETYLKRVESVRPLDGKVYDRPDDQSRTSHNRRWLNIVEVQGDWLRVGTPETARSDVEKEEGWIRWREGNDLKMLITEMAYE